MIFQWYFVCLEILYQLPVFYSFVAPRINKTSGLLNFINFLTTRSIWDFNMSLDRVRLNFVSRKNLLPSIKFDYFTTIGINGLLYRCAVTPDVFKNVYFKICCFLESLTCFYMSILLNIYLSFPGIPPKVCLYLSLLYPKSWRLFTLLSNSSKSKIVLFLLYLYFYMKWKKVDYIILSAKSYML